MNRYIRKIIGPYVKQKRYQLQLPEDHKALYIFDNFKHSALIGSCGY